jgi:hypothetical protein
MPLHGMAGNKQNGWLLCIDEPSEKRNHTGTTYGINHW